MLYIIIITEIILAAMRQEGLVKFETNLLVFCLVFPVSAITISTLINGPFSFIEIRKSKFHRDLILLSIAYICFQNYYFYRLHYVSVLYFNRLKFLHKSKSSSTYNNLIRFIYY